MDRVISNAILSTMVALLILVVTSPMVAGYLFRMSVIAPMVWLGAVDMDTATNIVDLHW